MKTRVRRSGRNEDRTTGNMVWGEFVHLTSRPVGGIPDPHLHAHCFVHNVTFDGEENRWKAGQFRDLKRDAPYFEAKFHVRLARHMQELGLAVERNNKGWEIAGIDRATLDKFSRRTALIEEKAAEQGITSAQEKSDLGAKTRERKQKELSMGELREAWRKRLFSDERSGIDAMAARVGSEPIRENRAGTEDAARLAIDHCFERESVVPERKLLAEALRRSIGQGTTRTAEAAVASQNLIVAERDGRRFATTGAVLGEEKRMLAFARNGRGSSRKLGKGPHVFKREKLNDGQRRAVRHVLESTDRVILIRGAAGVGKTTMMQEAVEAIEAGGQKVHTFAPSASASRGTLAREGFKDADTVARLLKDESLQGRVKGSVLWIDEAGLLGAKATVQLFDLAEKLDARLILSGDRFQHGSVERGAVLRLLETEAGLVPAEIKDIMRQRGAYKQAVKALSEGRTEDGFDQLNQLGWIREVDESDRYKALANDYVATVKRGKTAIVISPTHGEGAKITAEIRAELKEQGRIGTDERTLNILEPKHLTQGERADAVNHLPGDILVFHQNAKGYRKGQHVRVGGDKLPLDQAARFQAFRTATIPVAKGDVLRVTQNGKTKDGLHRLNNGSVFTVQTFSSEGDLVLTNGWTVAKDYGHLAHGVCVTSHASQGATVDRVFIGQGVTSNAVASREQFYVSVSRGREQATVYTDDKASLLEAVRHSDERMSATEFVAERQHRERGRAIERLNNLQAAHADRQPLAHNQEVVYER